MYRLQFRNFGILYQYTGTEEEMRELIVRFCLVNRAYQLYPLN